MNTDFDGLVFHGFFWSSVMIFMYFFSLFFDERSLLAFTLIFSFDLLILFEYKFIRYFFELFFNLR